MKNNQNKIIVLVAIGFITFLVGGYMFVSGAGPKTSLNEEVRNSGELNTLVEEYYKEREKSIDGLVKKDLYGDVVEKDDCGIVEEASFVNVDQLLSKKDWRTFLLGVNGLMFFYPKTDWFVQTEDDKKGKILVITTTKDGSIKEGEPWAKITIGEYDRAVEESLLDWLEGSKVLKDGEEAPSTEKTIQYVSIGESTFLGSVFFEENIWVGKKNVYAEVSAENIFYATLEVKNMTPDSKELGTFDQVFYTILESLEVKQ